jgi:hypothetical protein
VSDAPGKVTVLANGKRIPGCINIALTGSSPNYSAQCQYKPASRGNVILVAQVTPSDSHLPGSSPPLSAPVSVRNGLR